MAVDYDFCTNQESEVKSEYIRAFEFYAKQNDYIKVGVTSDPVAKEREHVETERWDRMIAIFETDTFDSAKEVEIEMMEYIDESKRFDKAWNVLYKAQENAKSENVKYYTYFLVDNDCQMANILSKAVLESKKSFQ